MAVLQSLTKENIIVSDLKIAKTFRDRGVGLLGQSSLPTGQGLWIHHCNSIHTFFMKFTIDCVFVNRSLKVVALNTAVRPWRLILPKWNASSVFELPAGKIREMNIELGDQLYVGN
ncbi:MAG: DUF192 domain-containing protein [Bdellovibrionia bacterium]